MWVEEQEGVFLTELTSCIMKYCTLSVVKFLVVSTTLPFLILFDKEGKPSKYITFGRNSLSPPHCTKKVIYSPD